MADKKPIRATEKAVRRVFELLDKAGISGAEAARSLDVPASRISAFRSGDRSPTNQQLDALAHLVGHRLKPRELVKRSRLRG